MTLLTCPLAWQVLALAVLIFFFFFSKEVGYTAHT